MRVFVVGQLFCEKHSYFTRAHDGNVNLAVFILFFAYVVYVSVDKAAGKSNDDKSGNDRKLKCKIHKTVCDLLDDLIISGDIKSYESYRDSGSKKIEGVAITL